MKNQNIYIKLIAPKMSKRPMDSEFKRRMSPSLALVTLASLTPKEYIVKIEDENIGPVNFNDNPDLVGVTVNVDTSDRAKEIAEEFMERGSKVIFGGIHASANPSELQNFCDSVCIGEAEELWSHILQDFANNAMKKRYYKKDTTDLSNFPLPEWKFINASKYLYSNIVVTSRGCPFKCDFCYNSCSYINNSYRNRPLDHVLSEIKNLKTKQVYFIDDNLIGNKKHLTQLLLGIKELNIIWHGAVSANLYSDIELIDLMAESGCKSLFIGFESINQAAIFGVNKSQNNINNYEKLIKLLHDRGIMVNASLVFGLDHDDVSIFKNTLDWLIKNKVETMTAHILTPYPGTLLYKRMLKEGRITDFNLRNYNTSHVVFKPGTMSAEELKQGYLWIYKKFYTHRNIVRRLPVHKENYVPFLLFNYCYRKYGKLFSLLSKNGFMRKIGRLGSKLSYGIGS